MAETSDIIQAVENADSPAALRTAVAELVAVGSPEAVSALIKALGYNNPEVASLAVEGLVRLGDLAVRPLLEQLDDYNYGARAYSFRALATIGDPQALPLFLKAAREDFAPSVRRAAARGLGCLRWEVLPATQQAPAQDQVFQTLAHLAADPEWGIRYSAVVGIEGLGSAAAHLQPAVHDLLRTMAQQDPDQVVRARAALPLTTTP